jgi:hypothetical protein
MELFALLALFAWGAISTGVSEDPAALQRGCRGTLGVLKLEERQWLDRHVEKAANVGVG